jgi:hypothetical protein
MMHGLAVSTNSNVFSVIASQGEVASFPIGTTPFFPEIETVKGSSVLEIPCLHNDAADQEAAR